jgi:hypothetical protein
MTCEIKPVDGPFPDLAPARKYAAGLREIGAKCPAGASIGGGSLEAGADYIDRLADEVIRLRARLLVIRSIIGLPPDSDYILDRLEALVVAEIMTIRLQAALESIAAFAPDEGSAIDPSTQIATFARRTAREALGGGGES